MVRDCASILPSTSSTGTCPQGVSRLRLLHASPVRMTSSNGTLCTANASRIGSARPGPSQSAHAGQRQRSQTSQTSCVGIRRESSGGQERQGRAAGARTGDFVGRHRSASAAADPALRHATPAAASLVSRGSSPLGIAFLHHGRAHQPRSSRHLHRAQKQVAGGDTTEEDVGTGTREPVARHVDGGAAGRAGRGVGLRRVRTEPSRPARCD